MAEFIQRLLEQLGHNPTIAATGLDALHFLSTDQFEIAVIDRRPRAASTAADSAWPGSRIASRALKLALTITSPSPLHFPSSPHR